MLVNVFRDARARRWTGELATAALPEQAIPNVDVETAEAGTVPDLTGLTEDQARRPLARQGFMADVLHAPRTKLCIAHTPPVVARQDPAPWSVAPERSSVLLSMRRVTCGEGSTSL